MLTVFVSGPLAAKQRGQVKANMDMAKAFGAKLLGMGVNPIIPHANYSGCAGRIDECVILDACLDLLDRCDAVFLLPGWTESFGAKMEYHKSLELDIPSFDTFEDLEDWIDEQNDDDTGDGELSDLEEVAS